MGECKPIMCNNRPVLHVWLFLPHAASDAHTQMDISVCVEKLVEMNYEKSSGLKNYNC